MILTFSRAVSPKSTTPVAPRQLFQTRPFGDASAEAETSSALGNDTDHHERFGHSLSRLRPVSRETEPQAIQDRSPEPTTSDVEQPFPSPVRQKMEQLFSVDFSAVRLHEGEHADSFGARAVTRGNRIYFARGQYRPESPAGQALLGHELTHVAQQQSGGVELPQAKNSTIDRSSTLEAEAARSESAVLRGKSVQLSGIAQPGTVQMDDWDTEKIYQAPDKVFGPSSGAVNYNSVAQKLQQNPQSTIDPEHALTMGAMISNVTNPQDFENQMQPSDTNQKEWNNFIGHYPKWASQKQSRQKEKPTFKKVSKAAIDFTANELDGNIHFVKGDRDWGKAADKTKDPRTTASELRYIYRHREKLGSKAKFYDNSGGQVTAPWENQDTKDEWDTYEKRRQLKKQTQQHK